MYDANTLQPAAPTYFGQVVFTCTFSAPASDGGFVRITEGTRAAAYGDDADLSFVRLSDGRWLQVSSMDYRHAVAA